MINDSVQIMLLMPVRNPDHKQRNFFPVQFFILLLLLKRSFLKSCLPMHLNQKHKCVMIYAKLS